MLCFIAPGGCCQINDAIFFYPTVQQHLVCRVVQSLHINHMQMSIIEVFICRRLHMNTSMILICIWLVCRLCTTLHTKCCGAVSPSFPSLPNLFHVQYLFCSPSIPTLPLSLISMVTILRIGDRLSCDRHAPLKGAEGGDDTIP